MPLLNYTTFQRGDIAEGNQINEFFSPKLKWEQEEPVIYKGYHNNPLAPVDNAKGPQVVIKQFRAAKLQNSFSFSNNTLDELRVIVNSNMNYKTDGRWNAKINEDENGRISAKSITLTKSMPGMPNHIHKVFESIEFCNVALTLEFKTTSGAVVEKVLHFDKHPIDSTSGLVIPIPDGTILNERYFGTSGIEKGAKKVMYQAGACKSHIYFLKCGNKAIKVIIDYSLVFRYPNNDFEPVQVIMANKIYPQITFSGSIKNFSHYKIDESLFSDISNSLSEPGLLLDTAKIAKYHGRIKLIANNNSDDHLDLRFVGPDRINFNYLKTLRENNVPIPNNFEIVFKDEFLGGNVVGFYADTNMGVMTENETLDDRLHPKYIFNPSLLYSSDPSPFWYNAFDYMNYNVSVEKEFTGVWGKGTEKYKKYKGSFIIPEPANYTYPSLENNKMFRIKLEKKQRQGGFDNIHLHGYLGHYKDNKRFVIHAPICGYCCFHMHWRWGALATEVAGSPVFRLFSNGIKAAFDKNFKTRFMGWGKMNGILYPQIVPGAPLIPWNQTLKIAVTHPDAKAKDDLKNVTPTQETALRSLLNKFKAVWYSATITNENNKDVHVVLEQGCGYAFDYSETGKKIIVTGLPTSNDVNLPLMYRYMLQMQLSLGASYPGFLDKIYDPNSNVCSLSVSDMYEIQYRLMHFYNTNRGGNGDDSDPNQLMNCKDYDQVPSKSSENTSDKLNFQHIKDMEDQY